jgi:hypothetical protein
LSPPWSASEYEVKRWVASEYEVKSWVDPRVTGVGFVAGVGQELGPILLSP